MKTSKFFTFLLALCLAVILLTGSVAVPILCRPFYYAHIGPMELCEQTGLTEAEIRTAFDEMMDFCLDKGEFSTGVLAWSEEGKSHFADVKKLFLLDLYALVAAIAALAVLLIAGGLLRRRPGPLLGRGPAFWAGAGLGGVFLIIGGLAATDFDRAFVIFHTLFFPGKDNWLFDPRYDQIITILPKDFFMHCAILILAILVLGCVLLMAGDLLFFRRKRS